MRALSYQFLYAVKKHPLQIILVVLLLGVLLFYSYQSAKPEAGFYNGLQWIDPIIGVFTFFFAFFIWVIQLRKEWSDNLTNRMTVQFDFGGKTIMECQEAHLGGASDIRTWGQQIGAQMARTQRLKFDPYIKIDGPTIKFDENQKRYYKFYEAIFFLNEIPGPDSRIANPTEKGKLEANFKGGKCILWKPTFHSNGTITKKEEWTTASPKREI